jgi:hypothetical protein
MDAVCLELLSEVALDNNEVRPRENLGYLKWNLAELDQKREIFPSECVGRWSGTSQ